MTKKTLSEKVRRKLHQQVLMRVQEEAEVELLAQMAMQLHEEVSSEEKKMMEGGSHRRDPAQPLQLQVTETVHVKVQEHEWLLHLHVPAAMILLHHCH